MWCWILLIVIVFLLFHQREYYGRGGPLGDFLLTEGPPLWGTDDVPTGDSGYVYESAL